jgi:hypothetical protein
MTTNQQLAGVSLGDLLDEVNARMHDSDKRMGKIVPCPDWCDQKGDHPWDEGRCDGAMRTHRRHIGILTPDDDTIGVLDIIQVEEIIDSNALSLGPYRNERTSAGEYHSVGIGIGPEGWDLSR